MSNDFADSGLVDRTLGSGDHKTIGRLWIVGGLAFGVAALVLRFVAAIEQLDTGDIALLEDANELVQVWSMSRDLLIFGSAAAVLVGIATFIVPLQVGASSIAFPRGAAAAFWTWLASVGILVAAYVGNGGPGGGTRDFVVLWAFALGGTMVGIVWALVCLATTILGARADGMRLEMVPVTTWSFLVFSLLGIVAIPIQVGQLILAYIDVRGGYQSLVDTTSLAGVMDTVILAPAIYWLVVPALGMAVEAIGVHADRPIRFHRTVMVLLGLLAVTAFAAEVTSFGNRGRPVDFDNGLLVAGLLASVVPILGVLALTGDSLRRGRPVFRVPLVAGLIAGLVILGGAVLALLGVIEPIVGFFADLAGQTPDVPDALTLNGTTFNAGVTALVVTGALTGALAGIHHWGHKIWGHRLSQSLGLLGLVSLAGGGVLWAVGELLGGLADQEALPAVEATDDALITTGNLLVLLGVAGAAAGVGVVLLNAVAFGVLGRGSVAEPWRGKTLEWWTDSPPPYANFERRPVVTSILPLEDPSFGEPEPAADATPEEVSA